MFDAGNLMKALNEIVDNDEKIENLLKNINMENAEEYAAMIGMLTAAVSIGKKILDLKNDELSEAIGAALSFSFEKVSKYSTKAIEKMLEEEKLGIKATAQEYDQDRAQGIVKAIERKELTDETIKDYFINFAENVNDSTIKLNAERNYTMGLGAKIKRVLRGKGCAWCTNLAKEYDYPDGVTDDTFSRHENCRCLVTYSTKRTKGFKNVHTKEIETIKTEKELQEKELIKEELDKKRRIAISEGKKFIDSTEQRAKSRKTWTNIYNNMAVVKRGKTFIVDGVNVVQKAGKKERQTEEKAAKALAVFFGGNIGLNPEVYKPKHTNVADYLINGEYYDLKTISSNKESAIYNATHDKKEQAQKFVIDITKTGTDIDYVEEKMVNYLFNNRYTDFVKELVIMKNEQVIKVYERV